MKRLKISGCRGGDEADALGDRGDCAKERHRLEPGGRRRPRPRVYIVSAEGGVGVGHEQQIELAALGQPSNIQIMRQRLPAVWIDIGIAPSGNVMPGGFEEHAKLHHGRVPRPPLWSVSSERRRQYD